MATNVDAGRWSKCQAKPAQVLQTTNGTKSKTVRSKATVSAVRHVAAMAATKFKMHMSFAIEWRSNETGEAQRPGGGATNANKNL
jgi:hypothetical protein